MFSYSIPVVYASNIAFTYIKLFRTKNKHDTGVFKLLRVYSIHRKSLLFLVQILNFDSPSQQINYTVGSTSSLLYYSDAKIPDSSLRWTTETVTDGAQYNIEYTNPVLLSTVFSDVGAGVQTFSCFYRMSPVTFVGSLQLAIRGNNNMDPH